MSSKKSFVGDVTCEVLDPQSVANSGALNANKIAVSAYMGPMVYDTTDAGAGTIRGIAYTRAPGHLVVYYCGSGKLRKWSANTSTVTALTWPTATIYCTDGLVVDPNDGSLIFSYRQNNLHGIAKYLNP